MTIKVNNYQFGLLLSAVREGLKEARLDADEIFYTGATDVSGDWLQFYRVLRSIDKHQRKLDPQKHWGRISKRRAASIARRLASSQVRETPIQPVSRWKQLRQWLHI